MHHPPSGSFDRRRFLRRGLAGALALSGFSALPGLAEAAFPDVDLDGFRLPMATLGQTGIEGSILGMGTGTNGYGGASDQTRLGHANLVSLLEYAYDRGIRYFDMADQYGSHPMMHDALEANGGSIPRENVLLLTKINMDDNYSWGSPIKPNGQFVRECLDRFRMELGTDYLDVVLLHHMGLGVARGNWTDKFAAAMDELETAKQNGTVRAHGISQHDDGGSTSPLEQARDSDWVDVDLVRFNAWGGLANQMDGSIEKVAGILRTMKDQGKGLIGMKVYNMAFAYSPGDLTDENKSEGMTFAARSPLLDMFTIGMVSRAQIDENLTILASLLSAAASTGFRLY